MFACLTGLRYGDLKGITRANYINGRLSLVQRKNKRKYDLPLPKEAKNIWEKYEGLLPVISNQRLNEYLKELLRLAEIDREIEVISNPAGIERRDIKKLCDIISIHDAVHTFITLAIQKGLSPYTISTLVGKSVKVILDHYYGQSINDFNGDLERLRVL